MPDTTPDVIKKPSTVKIHLSQLYVYAGRHYGPGEVEVPEAVAESLKKKEAAYADRLKEYEPPAPVTPSIDSGERHDPRKKPRQPEPVTTPARAAVGPDSAMQVNPVMQERHPAATRRAADAR